MSFQAGQFGFRVLLLTEGWPADWAERMKKRPAATDLGAIGARAVDRGWTMGGKLLDVELRPSSGNLVHVAARTAARKVQPALLEAATAAAVKERLAAEGKAFLRRPERMEIRRNVEEALLGEAQVALAAVPVLTEVGASAAFAGATSSNDLETLAVLEMDSRLPGFHLAEPERLAAVEQVSLRDRSGTRFSPETGHLFRELRIGCEFLTWLWWATETQGGTFQRKGYGTITAAVEGPLTLMAEDAEGGAGQVRLTEGAPTASAEAKAALLAGKTLRRARILLATDADHVFAFTLDGMDFSFRATKLPVAEGLLSAEDRLAARYADLRLLWTLFGELFRAFLDAWQNERAWNDTLVPEIREWVRERRGK
jgi:hypothetical protein